MAAPSITLAWFRLLRACESGAESAKTVCEELIRAGAHSEVAPVLTALAFDGATEYEPGGAIFERGLLEWEAKALEAPCFPRSGRLLIGGAGGGREIAALAPRGYAITAFEPTSLVAAAQRVAGGAAVFRASYRDLVEGAQGRGGPLAQVVKEPFDAVLLGWASLSHVTRAEDRTALLSALRRVSPGAPVLASFVAGVPGRSTQLSAVRRAARVALGLLGPRVPDNVEYSRRVGFVCRLTRSDIDALAADAGYRVAAYDDTAYGWAIFTPSSDARLS